jgi:hypothetical protein
VIRARLTVLCAIAFVTFVLAGPVAAAGTLAVTPASGAPGDQLTASGTGIAAGQPVTLQWDGNTSVGQGSSGTDGSFSIQFAIPANATPGGHQLRACIRSDCSIAPPFTVAVTTVSASGGPSPSPAPTGEASGPPDASPGASGSPGSSASPSEASSPAPSDSPVGSGQIPSEVPSGEPSPAASASGVIAAPTPTATAMPSTPGSNGRPSVALPWLLLVGAVLGLLLLGLYVVLQRSEVEAPTQDANAVNDGKD